MFWFDVGYLQCINTWIFFLDEGSTLVSSRLKILSFIFVRSVQVGG